MTGAVFAGQLRLLQLRQDGGGTFPTEAAAAGATEQPHLSVAAELAGQLNLVRQDFPGLLAGLSGARVPRSARFQVQVLR